MYGWQGNILKIDLTTRSVTIDHPDERFYRSFLGGSNLVAYYLLKEVPAGIDAFDPENRIVVATSVLTGTNIAGSSRHSIGCKSPLTGGMANSEAGGYFAKELKCAGFDAVVISGRAADPCYVMIRDGAASIEDGSGIWGKTTGEAEDILHREQNDEHVRILQTGVAGENLVRYAAVTSSLEHWNGRGGIGAVMGSKNLRAIAVRGTGTVAVAEPEKLKALVQWFAKSYRENDALMFKSKYGTIGGVEGASALGLLPTSNFRKGSAEEHAYEIGGIHLEQSILEKTGGCYACPVRCKRVAKYHDDKMDIQARYGGPEYETAGTVASNCEVYDIRYLCKANELCAQYGLDTISTGGSIAFAMECFEKGILTPEMTGGEELHFGDGDGMLAMIEKIAHRTGYLGKLLAEGSWRAGKTLGGGAEKYSMSCKKQEFPAHDPRGKWNIALGYAVSPTGGDHLIVAHDTVFENEPDMSKQYASMDISPMRYFGILDPMPAMSLSPEKLRLFRDLQLLWNFYDVMDICIFVGVPEYRMTTVQQFVEAIGYVTGWDMSMWEALQVSDRQTHMGRLFNTLQGLTKADDMLPERMFEPLENGAHKGCAVEREAFDKALATYYEMMGWTPDGKPTYGKFVELGMPEMYQPC